MVRPCRMMRHPVTQVLHLGQDVTAEQHGPATGRTSRMQSANTSSFSGSSRWSARPGSTARRRWPRRHQRRPSGGCPGSTTRAPSGRIEVETLQHLRLGALVACRRATVPARSITSPPVSCGHSVTSLGTYAIRRCRVAGSVQGSPPRNPGHPGRRPQQAEQDADGGGFARSVGPEEAVYLTGSHGQVQAVQGPGPTEVLDQAADGDRIGD